MNEPLTAGEPLAPPPNDSKSRRQPKPARTARPRRSLLRRFVRGVLGGLLAIVVLVVLVGGGVGYVAYERFSANLPDVDGLRNYQPRVMSRVYAGDARLMAELATERRIFVPYSAIPDMVKQAFVSAEDQNFWTHPGIDPLAIARAGVFDLTHKGRRPIGASTITQQVAKNMLLDGEVTLARKAREAILAMRIEKALTKQRILELYLNEIYLGMGSYGVAAAAQGYFNKPLEKLTLSECAFLAALPKAPNNYNPFKFADAAKSRRDWVVDRMAEDHAITAEQAAAAKAEPIIPAEFRRPPPIPGANWFVEEVRRELISRFGADVTTQGGLMVRTSLDPTLQVAAEKSVRDGLMAYDRKLGGWRGPVTHLDAGPALAKDWATPLGQVARPGGMLPDWQLAVVVSETDSEARVGWLEPAKQANQPPVQRTGALLLSDLQWARPVKDNKPGATPRKIADVMQPGDVVMVEQGGVTVQPVQQAKGAKTPAPPTPAVPAPSRMALRQIPAVQGALVSLDPRTGRVLALVGGWSFDDSQFNRATQAQRQPGSSFKPFVYLAALEKGISPSQRFLDAPVVENMGAAGVWRPNNYEMDFGGPTPLRVALEKSLNLVTLRVAKEIGMDAVADTAIAFHEVDNMPRVLPAAIGAVQTTVMREAGAYASIDAGGRLVEPTLIDSVQDPDGHVVWRPSSVQCTDCGDAGQSPQLVDSRKQIADPASVFQLITMMQGVTTRGTGVPVVAGLGHPIAGKTGTTQDFNDAWFSGFTPDIVTTVWVGFDNPASLGNNETGAVVAGPIWRNFMAVALKDRPVLNFVAPPGVTMAQWDSGSGMVTDAFKPDQTPGSSRSLGAAVSSTGTPSDGSSGGATPAAADQTAHGGVDNRLGGLY
jgi:penicillin-binding protein 1A